MERPARPPSRRFLQLVRAELLPATLCLLALMALRALIPAGFMPAGGGLPGEPFGFILCHGSDLPTGPRDPADRSAPVCPFALVNRLALALPDLPPPVSPPLRLAGELLRPESLTPGPAQGPREVRARSPPGNRMPPHGA